MPKSKCGGAGRTGNCFGHWSSKYRPYKLLLNSLMTIFRTPMIKTIARGWELMINNFFKIDSYNLKYAFTGANRPKQTAVSHINQN